MDVNVLWNLYSDMHMVGIMFILQKGRAKSKTVLSLRQVGPAEWVTATSTERSL